MLALAVSVTFFFVVWGVLRDSGDETPWITAGIGAGILLVGAVLLREIIMRRARAYDAISSGRTLAESRGGRYRAGTPRETNSPAKLTLEANAAILNDIRVKSEAANVLSKFSSGHREVFELCGEYMSRNESELKNVSADSPRLPALLRGRTAASELHRFHLLRWAEIEARTLTGEARSGTTASERIAAAQNALHVVGQALHHYPSESSLLESRSLLESLVVSIKVADMIESAERAAFDGRFQEAIGFYREALFELGRDNLESPERASAATRITVEIDKLRGESGGRR